MEIITDFAKNSDIPAIMALLMQVHKVHSDGRPDLFESGTTKYDQTQLKEILTDASRPVIVAREDGKVVGYSMCQLKDGHFSKSIASRNSLYIDDLCVDESMRGRGVGTILYNAALRYAKEHGCYNLTLNVWELNSSAKAFYSRMGLKPQRTTLEKIL